MRTRIRHCVLVIGSIGALGLVLGGCATTGAPTAGERDEVVMVVNQLFEAMRTKDEASLRGVFAAEVAVTAISPTQGARTTMGAPDSFVNSIMGADSELIERMWDAEVRMDGDLATLWAPYDFYRGDTFSHCGYDSFQLLRGEDGWRIISVAFTRRFDGCE